MTISQVCPDGKVTSESVVELKRLDDLRQSYGFIDNIPDFAGYIDYMQPSAFNRDFVFGNDVRIKVNSKSNFASQVRHQNKVRYTFTNFILEDKTELYFADLYTGMF